MALAVMLLGAIAAPAVAAPSGTDAPALAPIEIERLAVHARVGEWDAPRPVLIPGLYWAPLGAPQLRVMPRSALVGTAARLDQRTLEGWVLAHSTATSLP
jgi:hypothetical protein